MLSVESGRDNGKKSGKVEYKSGMWDVSEDTVPVINCADGRMSKIKSGT